MKVLPAYFNLTLTQENNQGIGLSYVVCNMKQNTVLEAKHPYYSHDYSVVDCGSWNTRPK